jgi:peptidoglycan/LPS O-acetylase OafA/YrhL
MSTAPQDFLALSHPQMPPPANPAEASKHTRPRVAKDWFYHPELDAIRLFLFFGVWAYHALPKDAGFYVQHHFPPPLASVITGMIKAGMCSLDVFFILSAFLITELLLRERESRGAVDLKAFYVRRLLRIWPLYFFVIALAAVISIVDRSQPVGWAYALAFLLFSGNWMMVLHGPPGASIIVPLWSVSFEEQFYLLWPLALRTISRATIVRLVVGLLLVAALVRFILLLEHQGAERIWFNSLARLDSIAFGILLAVIFHGRALFRIGLPARLALFLAGICAWVVVGQYCGLADPTPPLVGAMIGYPLMSLGGVTIFLSVLGSARDGAPFMRNSLLVYLGKISFGLYAYHLLSLRFSNYLFGDFHRYGSLLSWVFGLAFTFLVAIVSFKWLESPFLRLKRSKFTHIPSGPAC